MRMLIVTQAVDTQDPILGFVHRWIEEFAKHCDHITVIGQRVGSYDLPQNVDVLSLGKESGLSRLRQILRFWKLCVQEHNHYDVAFVHMTPIWVVLGGPLWFLLRKRMYLWYEARGTRWPLRAALFFVQKVFSASEGGIPLSTRKSVVTGHGIDTEFFCPRNETRNPNLLVTVGRRSRSKRLECIETAVEKLPSHYTFRIIDSTPPEDIPSILSKATLFLHASTTPLDKAVLEALACGCLVISTNPYIHSVLPKQCRATEETFAQTIRSVLSLPSEELHRLRTEGREIVEKYHSLQKLVPRLLQHMSQ